MSMIALYKGTSLVSRLIRWATWSEYSHASWIDGIHEYEAWHTRGERFKSGVRCVIGLGAGHSLGTVVDIYQVPELTVEQAQEIRLFLISQIGKRYDLRGVLGFISRRDSAQYQDRWFCSELVFTALLRVGLPLLSNVPAHRVSPGMLALSPRLRYVCTRRAMLRDAPACTAPTSDEDALGADAYIDIGRNA